MELLKVPSGIVLYGERSRAIIHKGRAQVLLSICEQHAAYNGLSRYKLEEIQDDGTLIVALKNGNMSVARIYPSALEPKVKLPEDAPGMGIIIYVGTEANGYDVGRFSTNGQLKEVSHFRTAKDMYQKFPGAKQDEVFKRRISVLNSNPATINMNDLLGSLPVLCTPPGPYCPVLPLSPTTNCVVQSDHEFEFHHDLKQSAKVTFENRQWCSSRDADGNGTHFFQKRDWLQVSDKIGGVPSFGARVCIPRVGDNAPTVPFSAKALAAYTLVIHNWYRCTGSWLDNSYWMINQPTAYAQAFFVMPGTPIGPALMDTEYVPDGYFTAFLSGEAKIREDTDEPFLNLPDIPVTAAMLDPEQRRNLYAFSSPIVGGPLGSFVSPAFLLRRTDGAPNTASNLPAHSLMFSRKGTFGTVHLYVRSFLEVLYNLSDGEYIPQSLDQRFMGRAKVEMNGETDAQAEARGKTLMLNVESFLRAVRVSHVTRGLMPENARSMAGCIGAYLCEERPEPDEVQKARIDAYNLINDIRILNNLTPLSPDGDLEFMAEIHALDCAANNLESHESSYGGDFGDRVYQTMYGTRALNVLSVGENVAWGYQTAAAAVEGWMNSPGHRANILKEDWLHTGIAVRRSEAGQPYWVQVFGVQDY